MLSEKTNSPVNNNTENCLAPTTRAPIISNKDVSYAILEAQSKTTLDKLINQADDPSQASASSVRITPKMIKGTNTTSTVLTAEDRKWLYIGGLDYSVTSNILSEYLKVNSVDVLTCEKLESRYNPFSAFKISINAQEEEKLFDSELWPETGIVKPFIFHKSYSGKPLTNNKNNSNNRSHNRFRPAYNNNFRQYNRSPFTYRR